jgi:hypothetical protein
MAKEEKHTNCLKLASRGIIFLGELKNIIVFICFITKNARVFFKKQQNSNHF